MDEMYIKSPFFTKMISKLIEKVVLNKTERNINVQLDELQACFDGDDIVLRIEGEVKLSKEELKALLIDKVEI